MPLAPGTRLGPYEIVALIGAGGMGEVYRARDAKLNRDVAVKVLPELFALDPDRLARFEREAQSLAALNHPNIAQVFAVLDHPAALVMELVDGEDLSAVLGRSAMPLAEILPIARQIAEALEAAHELHIVHRDLKPANIKVRPDGTVKVLDFGLAKVMDPAAASSADAMKSPTLTARATQLGTIIGTAAYMAPEQAKGKAVDKRADIWAFGAVLYEMLAGRRAFEGDDISSTLAAVLMKDPDWTALPAGAPSAVVTLLHRCLERDPKARLRDIGEARLLLGSPDAVRAQPAPAPARAAAAGGWAPWCVAAIAGAAAVAFALLWTGSRERPPQAERIEASLAPPPGHSIGAGFALSPDGHRLVFEAVDEDTGALSLWIRELASATPVKISGSDGAAFPFWSPDGAKVAFFAEGKLKKTDLQGSPPEVICDAPSPRGGAWGPDGTIVFAGTFRTGLEKVDAGGGTPVPLTSLDAARHEKSHRWPAFLPDGRHILFVAQTAEASAKDDASTIEALELSTGKRTRLVAANSSPLYSAAGFLLFWRDGALRAQAFDANQLAVSGPVTLVASGVAFDSNELVHATVSASGTLIYSTNVSTSRSVLVLTDRAGRPVRTIADSVLLEGGLALSHDGSRLAAAVTADGARDTDIWIYDLLRGTTSRLTFDEGGDRYPLWSSDDTQLVYTNDSRNDGIVFRRFTDGRGQAEQIASNATGLWAWSLARDGTWLVAATVAAATGFDLVRYDIAGKASTPLVSTQFAEEAGALSPDERWLAYQSDETGRPEVYVRSLAQDGGRWRISSLGGTTPLWRQDGRELYFVTPRGQLMAVGVEAGAAFRPSAPHELFRTNFRSASRQYRSYASVANGQQFVVDMVKERTRPLLTIVTAAPSGFAAPAGK
jgi:eukaryotic-like serine/threonine-protein kinase